ncbi:MAG: hypothetical protein HY774_02785 [Acidobacteria bacterium]|nr:hypothetical protein [Acidobacteriota bacterium]
MHVFKSPYRRIWSPVLMFLVLMGLYISPKTVFQPRLVKAATTPVFINEIHYDNTGTDAGEAIEVAGPAGTDLTGWTIVLYNGSGGVTYDTGRSNRSRRTRRNRSDRMDHCAVQRLRWSDLRHRCFDRNDSQSVKWLWND